MAHYARLNAPRVFFVGLALAAIAALSLVTALRASAQASCLGSAATITGTSGDDILFGTPGDDVIAALGGNDVVGAGGGNDKICLGSGVDVAEGGQGDDEIEGGADDDLLVGDHLSSTDVGSGDDDVAGGEGDDVVIGDVSNEVGSAAGEGDDKVNGGAGNDVVIGDAYSNTVAAGTGEDDIDAGPGSDVVAGDAMVGDPVLSSQSRSGVEIDPAQAVGVGAGGDEVNTQTGDDLIAGDVLSFNADPVGAQGRFIPPFEYFAWLYCGKRLASQVLRKLNLGMSFQEIKDFADEKLKAEFDEDFVVGDCANLRRRNLRSAEEVAQARERRGVNGGGPDEIKSGNEGQGFNTDTPGSTPSGDIVFGGSVGDGQISNDKDNILLQNGNDVANGDGAMFDSSVPGHYTFFGRYTTVIEAYPRPQPIPPTGDTNSDGVVDSADFTVWRNAFRTTVETTTNGGRQAARSGGNDELSIDGGGKDVIRGGNGTDFLEGGPKKDKCQGGGGDEDKAKKKGSQRCERISGVP